jgi:hypothetical protein
MRTPGVLLPPPSAQVCSKFLSIIGGGSKAAHHVGRTLGEGNRGVVNIRPTEDVSLQPESLTNHRPRAVQFALPIHPVMRTWPVQINLCIQPQSLYPAGECPVLRSD